MSRDDAISYRVFTIGEAVKSLTPKAKNGHPKVPWSNIANMRDLIGHHYYRRDPQIILATIREWCWRRRPAVTSAA